MAYEAAEFVSTIGIALIAVLGLTGFISPSAVGYSIVLLKGFGYFFELAEDGLEKRKFYLVVHAFFAASLLTLGALGAAGILPMQKMAWSAIGIIFANCVLNCALWTSKRCYKEEKLGQKEVPHLSKILKEQTQNRSNL